MSENKNDHIDDAVRGAFASSSKKAPSDLWRAIDDKISPAPEAIDASVKASFDSLNHTVPEEIWGGINKQLNIDTVWSRLNAYLNGRTRRRLLWFRWRIAIVTLLLVVGTATIFFWRQTLNGDTEKELALVGYKSNTIEVTETIADSEQRQNLAESIKDMSNQTDNDDELLDGDIQGAASEEDTFEYQKRLESDGYLMAKREPSNNPDQSHEHVGYGKHSSDNGQFIEDASNAVDVDRDHGSILNDGALISLSADPVQISWDTIQLMPFELASDQIKAGWAYGAYVNPFYGVLWNNESRNGLMASSLIALKPSISWSAGADISYYIDDNSFLDFRLGATQYNQVVGNYRLGHYFEKRSRVNFLSGIVSYGINKPLKGNKNNLLSLSAGLGIDLLVNGTNTYSDEKNIDEVFYKSMNPLISLSAGNTKLYNRFELEYGIRSTMGLFNIFEGDKFLPSDFNVTRTFGIGLYTAFRLASSKKSK